jgi:trimeric autotransporter adhesin
VKFHLNRFLRRVRIHGGEFDTSARAMYRVSEKGSLISYESAFSTRAELRIVRGSTIERKQMSTKTTFKRIALVTVAALGFGVLASAPSSAAPSAAFGPLIGDSTAGQQVVNGLAQMTISYNETITIVATSGVGSIVSAVASSPDGIKDTATVSAISGGTFTITDADAATDTGTVVITLTSAVAGDQVITMTPYTSTGALGTAVTKTLKWVTALTANTYDHSYAYISGETASAASANMLADTTTAASASTALHNYDATLSTTVSRARIWVKQFSPIDTETVSTLAAGKGKEVIVEITGAGSLGSAANQASGSVLTTAAASTGGANATEYWVFSDGRTGEGVITIKVGGTLVATKKVTFFGPSASYAIATATGSALSKLYLGVGETATVKFSGLDKSGKVSSLVPTISNAITDTATVATVTVATNVVTITGVKVGKSTVYAADASTKAAATLISAGVDIEVTGKTAKTVTMSFDKTSYAPGEKMTLTVSAVDANGRPVADGSRALLAASATANILPNGTLPAASVDLVSGKAEYTLYAPASAGELTITAKEGTDTDSTTKAAITATTSVVNPGAEAATAAAELAEAAAQDATDAALDATEAATLAGALAQEAVDAVADLSTQVATLIAALKKQITTLTNLVIKIQKKVRA